MGCIINSCWPVPIRQMADQQKTALITGHPSYGLCGRIGCYGLNLIALLAAAIPVINRIAYLIFSSVSQQSNQKGESDSKRSSQETGAKTASQTPVDADVIAMFDKVIAYSKEIEGRAQEILDLCKALSIEINALQDTFAEGDEWWALRSKFDAFQEAFNATNGRVTRSIAYLKTITQTDTRDAALKRFEDAQKTLAVCTSLNLAEALKDFQ